MVGPEREQCETWRWREHATRVRPYGGGAWQSMSGATGKVPMWSCSTLTLPRNFPPQNRWTGRWDDWLPAAADREW